MDFNKPDPRDINFALSYPFAVFADAGGHAGSFVYVDGHAMALSDIASPDMMAWTVEHRGERRSLGEVVAGTDHAAMSLNRLTPIVSAGSNASPLQLYRKFRHREAIIVPCLRLEIPDWTVLYAAHIAPYGSIPASLEPCPGARTSLIVNLLDEEALEGMHVTESIGTYYRLAELDLPQTAGAPWASGLSALGYTSHTGHLKLRLEAVDTDARAHPPASQWQAQEAVIALLGEPVSVIDFIAGNIADPDLRRARERRLIEALAEQG